MFLLDGVISIGNVTCGDIGIEMAPMVPRLVSTIVTLIKIGVPLLLIVFGMLDLGKSVMAQKEDEIKKGQQMFIKRLIAAVIVFFVVYVVQIVIGAVSTDKSITSCIDCFINGDCKIVSTNEAIDGKTIDVGKKDAQIVGQDSKGNNILVEVEQ